MELFSFSPLDFCSLGYWLSEKTHHILDADRSIYCLLEDPVPVFQLLQPNWCCNCLLSGQLLQGGGEHGKTMLHGLGPLSHFSGCEASSLVRSTAKWNTVRVDKEFCELTSCKDGGLAGALLQERRIRNQNKYLLQ